MRDQLRPLEGELVFVFGKAAEYSNRDGKDYLCVPKAKIHKWDGYSAVDLRQPPAAMVDHLWVSCSSRDKCKMYQDFFGLTRIRYYVRKDGSVDLGCEPLYYLLDCDKHQDEWHASRRYGASSYGRSDTDHINSALYMCAHQGKPLDEKGVPSYIFSRFKDLSEIWRFYQKWDRRINEQRANFLKAQTNCKSSQRGRCRSAGSFADLMS